MQRPVETASILFCLTKKDLPQHRFFLEALEEGQKAEPLLGSCLKALTQDTTLSRMQDAFRRSPYQNKEFFSFRVGETAVELTPAFRRWWEGFYERENRLSARVLQRCLITGELTSPPLNYGRLRLSWPAKDPLYSLPLFQYNRDAYFSYGLRQAHNASMDGRHVEMVSAALTVLIRRAPQLAGSRLSAGTKSPPHTTCRFGRCWTASPLPSSPASIPTTFSFLFFRTQRSGCGSAPFWRGTNRKLPPMSGGGTGKPSFSPQPERG